MSGLEDRFATRGWIRFPHRFEESCLNELENLEPFSGRGKRLSNMEGVSKSLSPGISKELMGLSVSPKPLRAVGFNKSASGNWSLPWHQDRVTAMKEKTDDPDLKNWTLKKGVWHCEPPEDQLARLVFLYIAFDPMTAETGQLELLEGSHKFGAIMQSEIAEHVSNKRKAAPHLSRGEALLISGLLIHRSSRNKSTQTRRSFRIDFEKR